MNHRSIACLVAGLGATLYLVVAFGMSSVVGTERFGTFIYNYYFLALLEGRFDVPIRIATLEGHYDAAGRAFIYHGLAPLITRALAWPFVDLTEVSLAPLTIGLAAVGGTAVYHFVFVQIIEKFASGNTALQISAGLLLGIMIWFVSPGLLLVANDGLYGEPIAIAYLFVACFLGLLAQPVLFDKPIGSVLLPMALFAGLCVHARPHLAIGLYVAVCLLGLVVLWQKGWCALPSVAGAITVLALLGACLLAFNYLRFGDILQTQGAPGTGVEYGHVYWGVWSRGPPTERTLVQLGSFHLYRVVPHLMLYLFDLPFGPMSDALERAFRYMTSSFGSGRIRGPRVGMVYLWLPWFVLAIAGLGGVTARLRHAWAPLLATAVGSLLMASYVTSTFRYRFDLWPFLVVLGLLALPRVLLKLKARQHAFPIVLFGLALALVPSLFMMSLTGYVYAFNHVPVSIYSRWSYETCAEMVTSKPSLGPDAVERLCGL